MAGRPNRGILRNDPDAPHGGNPLRDESERHPVGCKCTRCRGIPEGNSLGVVHGAFSPALTNPRAEELMEEIRPSLPMHEEADEYALGLLALTLAQIERMQRYNEERALLLDGLHGEELMEALVDPKWVGPMALSDHIERLKASARRSMNDLGMSPSSRAKLARDVGIAADAGSRAQSQLAGYLERKQRARGLPESGDE